MDISVHVSWNGDTETACWRFYSQTAGTETEKLLGEAKLTGFETTFVLSLLDSLALEHQVLLSAEAIDANGIVLVRTRSVHVQEAINTPRTQTQTSNVSASKMVDGQQQLMRGN